MIFDHSTMFVNQIMSRNRFNDEINVTLIRFQQKIPIEFARTLNLIRVTIHGNALTDIYSPMAQPFVINTDQGEDSSFGTLFYIYVNWNDMTNCSCATSQTCTIGVSAYDNSGLPSYVLEGLALGCSNLEMVLRSSLSCFYSLTCIIQFLEAMRETSTSHYCPHPSNVHKVTRHRKYSSKHEPHFALFFFERLYNICVVFSDI